MKVNRTKIHTYEALNNKIAELTSQLEKSDFGPEPEELEDEGFQLQSVFWLKVPEDAVERTVEVFENKDGERIVIHEVFQDREGGMYQNAAFAKKSKVLHWLKPTINQTLEFPNQYLLESVLSVCHNDADDNPYKDSRNSYGCAHYKWILEDKEMHRQVLKSYLENNQLDDLIEREKEIYRAAKVLYARLNSKQ